MQEDNQPRLDSKQYDLIKKCAENKDMSEWNRWRDRDENEQIEILLEGADLEGLFLERANLADAFLGNANFKGAKLANSYLNGSNLEGANLQGADVQWANLYSAGLRGADLTGAFLNFADMTRADLMFADFSGSHLEKTHLTEADLRESRLRDVNFSNCEMDGAILEGLDLNGVGFTGASLKKANLCGVFGDHVNFFSAELGEAQFRHASLKCAQLADCNANRADFHSAEMREANLNRADLEGAMFGLTNLSKAHLSGANLKAASFAELTDLSSAQCDYAILDGETRIFNCIIDQDTDFTGVGLDSARIDPDLKIELEGNVRRLRWREWYKKKPEFRFPVLLFWCLSNYGQSTKRIFGSLMFSTFLFAVIYYCLGIYDLGKAQNLRNPGVISNLFVINGNSIETSSVVPADIVFIRALYFSFVTMTTLGFGDINANPDRIAGHLLLIVQVLIGYLLFSLLITRIAVLFTTGGPGKNKTDFLTAKSKAEELRQKRV